MDKWATLSNPVCWAILGTALAAFAWAAYLLLERRDADWLQRTQNVLPTLRVLVSVLPLLGLLGTIVGLLSTFRQMSIERGFDPSLLVSGGIADALVTTQIGLLTAIPGWVLLALLGGAVRREAAA
ncbi:MAG: MotA/TolQ/ExbB proton channel family protein [Pseudomonadota bacterium]